MDWRSCKLYRSFSLMLARLVLLSVWPWLFSLCSPDASKSWNDRNFVRKWYLWDTWWMVGPSLRRHLKICRTTELLCHRWLVHRQFANRFTICNRRHILCELFGLYKTPTFVIISVIYLALCIEVRGQPGEISIVLKCELYRCSSRVECSRLVFF